MATFRLRSTQRKWLIAFCGLLFVATSLFGSAGPSQPGASIAYEALPLVRSRQNHLCVRAFINDKPALLVIDTGAPVSAIALHRRRHFGLRPLPGTSKLPPRLEINGVFDRVGLAGSLRLGVLNLIDEPMVAIDLSDSSRAARVLHEEAIDGILGADILFPTSALIDCQQQMLIFKLDPRKPGSVPGYDFRGLRAVPMHVSRNYNLYVNGSINGAPAQLMVDTGAFATLMHQRFIRRMNIPTRETSYQTAGVNISLRGLRLATIKRFSIGSVNLHGKEVGVMDLRGLVHDGLLEAKPMPVAGLLGSEILRRHHGVIDFGTLTLYLRR
jgi:predicted aspartyl protease